MVSALGQLWAILFLDTQVRYWFAFFPVTVLFGLGMGPLASLLNAAALADIESRAIATANGVHQSLRYAVGGMGTALALAASQGIFVNGGPEPDYPAAVELVLAWITEHRDELVAAEPVDGVAEVTNLNVPTCPTGELKELVVVPVATEAEAAGLDYGAVDCEARLTDPTNDLDGFLAGFPVQSELAA